MPDNHKGILIVDDEPANVALLHRTLERIGLHPIYASTDPNKVEELVGRHSPDVILLDLHMPRRDGFEVLKALGQSPEADHPPVLVLTADTSPEAKRRALSMGAKDFLHKPFDLLEVTLRVRRLLETRLLHLRLRDENSRLEAAVRERTAQLEAAHLDMLRRLAQAAEHRDDQTGEHVRRVAENAGRIALEMGAGACRAELIRLTAPLHDVGKIAVPDALLRKPGKLSEEEFATVKTHTVIGASLLEGSESEYLAYARRIARSHHERWDGGGYPDGLAGEGIPLEARIVAVVDVFDALTSHRPYKKAWPRSRAVAEIEQNAGSQFDPEVVAAFSRLARANGLAVARVTDLTREP